MNDQDGTSQRQLPVPIRSGGGGRAGSASVEAQLLGAGGVRRGLRGGVVVLQTARGAYLRTEWSGEADRRPAAGLLTRRTV